MANPTFGFRTLKGQGSRLLRDLPDNDWVNVMTKEGTSGWKDGLIFTRHYVYYDGVNGKQHLYRIDVLDARNGLDLVATGFGAKSDDAWQAAYDDLKRKGRMPHSARQ